MLGLMVSPRNRLVVGCVAALILGASCGDDGDGSDGAAATTTTQAPAPSSTATTAVPEKELTATSRVRLDGIGPVTMRMTLAEATAAVGRRVAVDPDSLINDDDVCGFALVDGGPDGLGFMVNRDEPGDDWRIVRLDVSDVGIATGGGVQVGSTEDEVKRAYGDKIKTEPHHYTAEEGGHYMTLDVDGPGGMKLLFETDGAKVVTYRSGLEGAVDEVEGCL